jgi:hypothetical protein
MLNLLERALGYKMMIGVLAFKEIYQSCTESMAGQVVPF